MNEEKPAKGETLKKHYGAIPAKGVAPFVFTPY